MSPHLQNQCFRRSSPSLALSFSPTFEIAFFKKEKKASTQFSFLCMSPTVSGLSSWSFVIIGDKSFEVWQRALRMTGNTDAATSSKLFSLFFCLLSNISKESIFRKKDSAGDIPKERRRNPPNHGSTNDERDF